jgi:Thrombospondin type 3 repeat
LQGDLLAKYPHTESSNTGGGGNFVFDTGWQQAFMLASIDRVFLHSICSLDSQPVWNLSVGACPSDPNKTAPRQCGCVVADTDTDSDGVADYVDNCPNDANADQVDGDSDGVGNVCACPLPDESCSYQPDPPVVIFTDVVTGNDNMAYYRIQMNASAHWNEIIAPTNVTTKSGDLEVFGTAYTLELLGDLTITPDNTDTNATFELTGTMSYCTSDNSNRLACQQTWSYSFQSNETYPTTAQLPAAGRRAGADHLECELQCCFFDGECTPSFVVQPEATFSLSSPV